MSSDFEIHIRKKLTEAFAPAHLLIVNESAMHDGHAGSPNSGVSHFRIEIDSTVFRDLSQLERQRRVYSVLAAEMRTTIHALSLKTTARG